MILVVVASDLNSPDVNVSHPNVHWGTSLHSIPFIHAVKQSMEADADQNYLTMWVVCQKFELGIMFFMTLQEMYNEYKDKQVGNKRGSNRLHSTTCDFGLFWRVSMTRPQH